MGPRLGLGWGPRNWGYLHESSCVVCSVEGLRGLQERPWGHTGDFITTERRDPASLQLGLPCVCLSFGVSDSAASLGSLIRSYCLKCLTLFSSSRNRL